jgi:hypothetical protein
VIQRVLVKISFEGSLHRFVMATLLFLFLLPLLQVVIQDIQGVDFEGPPAAKGKRDGSFQAGGAFAF